MKITSRLMIATFVGALNACSGEAVFHHGGQEAAPATISLRQNDFALCGQTFWDDLYAMTVHVFRIGAENVSTDAYAEEVFALVRDAEEFEGSAEEFVDHIKDIPAQLVEIVREDSAVLDSCDNFSVALVGPP